MQVKVGFGKEDKPVRPFPKLMISKVTGAIALLMDYGKGTILERGSSLYFLGEFESKLKMENFEDFEGTLTLSNDPIK